MAECGSAVVRLGHSGTLCSATQLGSTAGFSVVCACEGGRGCGCGWAPRWLSRRSTSPGRLFFCLTGTDGGWMHGDALARQRGGLAALRAGQQQSELEACRIVNLRGKARRYWCCERGGGSAWASKRRPAATVSLCGGSRRQEAAGSTQQDQAAAVG